MKDNWEVRNDPIPHYRASVDVEALGMVELIAHDNPWNTSTWFVWKIILRGAVIRSGRAKDSFEARRIAEKEFLEWTADAIAGLRVVRGAVAAATGIEKPVGRVLEPEEAG